MAKLISVSKLGCCLKLWASRSLVDSRPLCGIALGVSEPPRLVSGRIQWITCKMFPKLTTPKGEVCWWIIRFQLGWIVENSSLVALGWRSCVILIVTWLILPVVICLSQRLSHACLSINKFTLWNCEWLIKSVIVYLIVPFYLDNRRKSRANTC